VASAETAACTASAPIFAEEQQRLVEERVFLARHFPAHRCADRIAPHFALGSGARVKHSAHFLVIGRELVPSDVAEVDEAVIAGRLEEKPP
jgi:phosphoenolpyruvate-protein kinase (PTS system EI component)